MLALHVCQRAGCRSRKVLTLSSSDAMCRIVDSASQLPTSCTLIGRPSLLVPNRIDNPGKPVRLSAYGSGPTPAQAALWQQAFGARARQLGWQPRPGEPLDDRLLRPALLPAVAVLGEDDALRGQALALARTWLADRNSLDADLRLSAQHVVRSRQLPLDSIATRLLLQDGVLALQADVLTPQQFVTACSAWASQLARAASVG